ASLYVFFFQAEDGIRDRNVTGVQTCALPISCRGRDLRAARRKLRDAGGKVQYSESPRIATNLLYLPARAPVGTCLQAEGHARARSEERRVGELCRPRM